MSSGHVHSDVQSPENENDLKQFLKVVRPDWSHPRKTGHNDIQRVIKKLKDIGVYDTWELVHRVNLNTINEDLGARGHNRFSKETVESIRQQSAFVRALEHLKEPYFRQVGLFAPVPQIMAGNNLRQKNENFRRHAVPDAGEPAGHSRPSTSDAVSTHMDERSASKHSSNRAFFNGLHDFEELKKPMFFKTHNVDGSLFEATPEDFEHPERPATVGFGPARPHAASCGTIGSLHDGSSFGGSSSSAQKKNIRCFLRHVEPKGKKTLDPLKRPETSPASSLPRPGSKTRSVSELPPTFGVGDRSSSGGNLDQLGSENTQSRSPSPGRSGGRDRAMTENMHDRAHRHPSWSSGSGKRSPPPGFLDGPATFPGMGLPARSPAMSGNLDVEDGALEGIPQTLPLPFAQKWAKLGQQINKEPWVAKFGSGKSVLNKGAAMLREQNALDERQRLLRNCSLEGASSPLRAHISSRIRTRMVEEKERDAQGVIDVQQRCMNIRKNLGFLQAARRDLCEQKRKAQDAIEGPRVRVEPSIGLSLSPDLFKKKKGDVQEDTIHKDDGIGFLCLQDTDAF